MNNLSYVCLTQDGVPVSVSQGLPLFTPRARMEGLGVRIRTPYSGGAELPITGLGIGPGLPGWCQRVVIPPHPGAAGQLRALENGKSFDFSDFNTPEVFWQGDPIAGTHVLLDMAKNRKVLVSPVDPTLRRGFWQGIQDALEQPEDPQEESWGDLPAAWGSHNLYQARVWVCLNPPPYRPENPIPWNFCAQKYVSFDFTGSRPAEAAVLAQEKLFGAAAYAVTP